MTPEEIIRVVRENVGKKVKTTPFPPSTTPEILLVKAVDEEGFTCYNFSDPDLIDPTIGWYEQFSEIAEVEPVED